MSGAIDGRAIRGRRAERAALAHLRRNGLKLVERNFSCKAGEIDLIMRDRCEQQGDILVFVEVRYRRRQEFGGAAASVTYAKQRRIIASAHRFLQLHPAYARWPCRCDVVAVTGSSRDIRLNWLQSAFDC